MLTSKKIREILINEFNISQEDISHLTDDTEILGSGLLDSFDFVQFLIFLSEQSTKEFDFSITPPDTLTTIKKIISYNSNE